MMTLALQRPEGAAFNFLVLFLVVLAGPAIMSRARIPGIIGLLVGGWAIGPHGLGLIGAGNQTVPELGQFGLLYLMFVAGLELDLGVLSVYRRTALAFGLATFILPFVCGVTVGHALGFVPAAAVLLGSLAASHTLITYPLVRAAGLARNPAVATAVGATVLTDTLSLILLAVVSGTQTGSGSTVAIMLELVVGLGVLGVFALLVLPQAAVWTFHRLGSDRSVRFLVALIAFLAAASVAQVFSIEGIVGAFFAGLGLNRLVPNEGQTMHQIDFFGSAVFVPIFLVSTGLLLDPSVMFELETMKFAVLFILACMGGKALAAVFAHVVLKVSRAEAGLMWVVSTPQAAATLAATTVGFEIGLFSTAVVNAVLVLILVSIITSTVLVPYFVKKVEVPRTSQSALGERVVLAVQHATPSPAVTQLAARLARNDGGVVQTLLVRHSANGPVDRRPVDHLAKLATREGFDGEVHVAVDRSTAHAVVHGSNDLGASLVVVETDLDADARALGGASWEEALASTINVPLLLVTAGGTDIKRVVVGPVDTDEIGEPAVSFVTTLAEGVSRGDVVVVEERADWVSSLQPGDVGFVAVPSFELMVGLPAPPAGATLAAVPVATLAQWRPQEPR
jgi:Kef-type K+ transport system membrane component KefB